MVDFIFVIIELFSLSLTVEMLQVEIGRSQHFSKGMGHLERRFPREGAWPTNHSWCLSLRGRFTAVSCGIKISTVYYLVLSQYTV